MVCGAALEESRLYRVGLDGDGPPVKGRKGHEKEHRQKGSAHHALSFGLIQNVNCWFSSHYNFGKYDSLIFFFF